MFERYIAYFKNNPEGYWFKAKLYGWGWMPVKWQGWLSLVIFILIVVWDYQRIDAMSGTLRETQMTFIPQFIILLLIFLFVTKGKREKARWQWGPPNEK